MEQPQIWSGLLTKPDLQSDSRDMRPGFACHPPSEDKRVCIARMETDCMSGELDCRKPIQTKINPGFGVIRERNRDFFLSFFVVPKNKQF